jgi:hypothetical protein
MVVWGATPILTRIALEDIEPLVVASLRTVLAGLLAVPVSCGAALPRAVTHGASWRVRRCRLQCLPIVYTIGQERTPGSTEDDPRRPPDLHGLLPPSPGVSRPRVGRDAPSPGR